MSLDDQLAAALVKLWGVMLMRVRYSDLPHWGLDGVSYHFSGDSRKNPGPALAGQIWSPDPRSPTGRLVAIVEGLREGCVSGDRAKLAEAGQAAAALCRDVGCEPE